MRIEKIGEIRDKKRWENRIFEKNFGKPTYSIKFEDLLKKELQKYKTKRGWYETDTDDNCA
jgi:hypothetical protein